MAKKSKLKAGGTEAELPIEQQLQVPLDLSMSGIADRWKRNVAEPAMAYWEYVPRQQKFMDAVSLLTDLVEPGKSQGVNAAQFLMTPKALQSPAYSALRRGAKTMKGSPVYEAGRQAYKGDIALKDKLSREAAQRAEKAGVKATGAYEPGRITAASTDPQSTIEHELWGHGAFQNLPIETKRDILAAGRRFGYHPQATYGRQAEESLAYTVQDLLKGGGTKAPEGFADIVAGLMIPGKQKGGVVPDVNELMHYLLNPPQGMTTMQGGGQINASMYMPAADHDAGWGANQCLYVYARGGSTKIRHGRGRTPDADRRGRSEANCSSARWGGWFNTLHDRSRLRRVSRVWCLESSKLPGK
jgi:hypothetical protein